MDFTSTPSPSPTPTIPPYEGDIVYWTMRLDTVIARLYVSHLLVTPVWLRYEHVQRDLHWPWGRIRCGVTPKVTHVCYFHMMFTRVLDESLDWTELYEKNHGSRLKPKDFYKDLYSLVISHFFLLLYLLSLLPFSPFSLFPRFDLRELAVVQLQGGSTSQSNARRFTLAPPHYGK